VAVLAAVLATSLGFGASAVATSGTTGRTIPAKVRAVLYDDVLTDVASRHITDVGTIWVVATTLAKTGYGTYGRPGSTPVYLLAWSGHEEIECSPPPGETCGGPDRFELEYYASNLAFVDGGSSATYPAPLNAMGHAVRLSKPKTSPQKTLTATIVVHVYWVGVPYPQPWCPETTCREVESEAIAVDKLGPNGEVVSSVETAARTIRVARGEYDVGRGGRAEESPKRVAVKAGQTVEVTLYDPIED
jgi:hypothetical protein